ncbi:hypothetical protein WR25_03356 [Diploscapter pachys]|uniref:Uncharacterized protein n=1 Tax=Diploscapter pachys TaxID=2018661 RepID=A0A2A2L3Q8_9BILA|nr:hypothetical protein WR25_03356 [Diploscapter pachys]
MMSLSLLIFCTAFTTTLATDALLYWNLTCTGPQLSVRFQWNCREKTDAGRYLNTNRYRLIEGLRPNYNSTTRYFKDGLNVDTQSLKTCSLSYFIYRNYDKFEEKLSDILVQSHHSKAIEEGVEDFAKYLKTELKKMMPDD